MSAQFGDDGVDMINLILQEELEDDTIEQYALLINQSALLSQQYISIPAKKGGSAPGRAPNLARNFQSGHDRIYNDYFSPNPVYPPDVFRRRFRMRRELFLRIHDALVANDKYFEQKPDALGNQGLSSLQKITAALRIFAYGVAGDAVDEYIRIGESTATKCLKRFATAVVNVFEKEYLRHPTEEDLERHLKINANRGFPGLFGSLDCTHWEWKNCPVAWQGQFQDRSGSKSLIMEAIATKDLWIWHAYIGMPGSNNDINVVDRSPLLTNMLKGKAPNVEFSVNGNQYSMCYLLCDGIYPDWSIFMKTISEPQGRKRQLYAKMQEAVRKDVERCFGVLQARFALVRNPARLWDLETLRIVWKAAVIMHNMIVEDEAHLHDLDQDYMNEYHSVTVHRRPHRLLTFDMLLESTIDIRNPQLHFRLRDDLVEHLWSKHGNE